MTNSRRLFLLVRFFLFLPIGEDIVTSVLSVPTASSFSLISARNPSNSCRMYSPTVGSSLSV